MVLSREPETIRRLSGEKDTDRTSLVCPMNVALETPEFRTNKRIVLSHEAVRTNWPSLDKAMSWMKWLCLEIYSDAVLTHWERLGTA